MNELNFFYNKHFACVRIHSLVDLPSDTLPDDLSLDPLYYLALGFYLWLFCDEVVFKSLLDE